jgi:hydroxyacylglutathione hydrolase
MADTLTPTIDSVLSMDFQELAYVIRLPDRRAAVVIDPGLDPDRILEHLAQHELTVVAVLDTHGHGDHIAGNAALLDRFPESDLMIGRADAHALTDPDANLSAMFGFGMQSPPATRLVSEGDTIEAAGLTFEVLDLPGHTPGHVGFLLRGEPIQVFSGDVLFSGSIGRSDFPGGDFKQLIASIRNKLLTLPDDTILHPGHGPATTVAQERATNPYL